MKKILLSLALFALVATARAQYVTATITVTNLPSDGDTIVLNGNTRTFKTTVTTPGTQITIGGSANATATNLYQEVAANPIAGTIWTFTTTNAVTLQGTAATATKTGSWGTIGIVSTPTTNLTAFLLPAANLRGDVATNEASQAITALALSTNALDQTATAASQLAGLGNAQTITGQKVFSGANTYSNAAQVISGGTVTNVGISNATGISGVVTALTNGAWTNPSFTNGQNFGNPFRSPGSGSGSEQFGLSASASGAASVAFGDTTIAAGSSSVAIGFNAQTALTGDVGLGNVAVASGGNAIAIGVGSAAAGASAIAMGLNSGSDHLNSAAFGVSAISTFDYSIAIGASATATAAHQLMLGTVSEYVHMPGNLLVVGVVSNLTTAATGTNKLQGAISYPRYSIAVVNGNNTITIGTNRVFVLTGATAPFTNCAITGGFADRDIVLINKTGQPMSFASNSGFDGDATRHLLTGTGAAGVVTCTNNPGFAHLIYDGTTALWNLDTTSP